MNKKIIYLIVCLMFSYISMKAQQSAHFPTRNATFSVSEVKFYFDGDTIIDSLVYTKTFIHYDSLIFDYNPNAYYYGAFRDDTVSRRAYCIRAGLNEERLFYDFSLQTGDTISVYSFSGAYWNYTPSPPIEYLPGLKKITIVDVDSILIGNEYRKRLYVRQENYENIIHWWIEGIGSSYGPFFPYEREPVAYTELLCVHVDNEIIFQSHEGLCWLPFINDGIEELGMDELCVYPNPANSNLTIEFSDFTAVPSQYRIFNNQGSMVKTGNFLSNSVDISHLTNGLYHIVIKVNDKLYCRKFVKN